jgi:hypothetical protein
LNYRLPCRNTGTYNHVGLRAELFLLIQLSAGRHFFHYHSSRRAA